MIRDREPLNYAEFWELIRRLCRIEGLSVTSAHRSKVHNLRVGGHAMSRHLDGLGADLVPDTNTHEIRERVLETAKKLGVWGINHKNHVHIQARPPRGR